MMARSTIHAPGTGARRGRYETDRFERQSGVHGRSDQGNRIYHVRTGSFARRGFRSVRTQEISLLSRCERPLQGTCLGRGGLSDLLQRPSRRKIGNLNSRPPYSVSKCICPAYDSLARETRAFGLYPTRTSLESVRMSRSGAILVATTGIAIVVQMTWL